jgi:S1-C subfamily serine protease
MNNLRNLFRIVLLSFLVGCCTAGTAEVALKAPSDSASTESRQKRKIDIERLRQATVAIVDTQIGFRLPVCAGIWVGHDVILTAAHCVDDQVSLQYSTIDEYNERKSRTAMVIKTDTINDIALLHAPINVDHPVITLSRDIISTGDAVDIIGHPVGNAWSYTAGNVSAIRSNEKGPTGKIEKIVQISAPVWMGNSGGGVFDSEGNLIGVCSWISKAGPNLAFFIHRDMIERFLKDNKVLPL